MNLFTRTFSKIFKSSNQQELDKIKNLISAINDKENEVKSLSESEIKEKTASFKKNVQNGSVKLDAIIPESFALVREAANRTLGERHFDVQLAGGLILHKGKIAEMKTGEGKTLVSTLPAYLNALLGNGVHIVTVNDYLAKRDSEWMGKVFNFLGVSTGCITNDLEDNARKKNYAYDITYATNNELGFDYLRNNLALTKDERVMKDTYFAIIDEVDSILIDEARTPLVISGAAEDTSKLFKQISTFLPNLEEKKIDPDTREVIKDGHFVIDEKSRQVELTDHGHDVLEDILQKNGMIEVGIVVLSMLI